MKLLHCFGACGILRQRWLRSLRCRYSAPSDEPLSDLKAMPSWSEAGKIASASGANSCSNLSNARVESSAPSASTRGERRAHRSTTPCKLCCAVLGGVERNNSAALPLCGMARSSCCHGPLHLCDSATVQQSAKQFATALLSAELIETTRLHLRQSFASESSLAVKAFLGEGTFGKVYSGEKYSSITGRACLKLALLCDVPTT